MYAAAVTHTSILTLKSFISFQPLEALLESPDTRECVEIDILLELSDAEIPRIRRIYETYGKAATKLKWSNWNQYSVSSATIVELLNLLPSIVEIEFSSWNKEFDGSTPVDSLNLPNLKTINISECNSFLLEFLAAAIPDNTLENLNVQRVRDGDASFSALITKQNSIKNLDISGMDFSTAEPLQALKLTKFRAVIYKSDETHDSQVSFLKSVISSQTELVHLDLLDDSAYSHTFVDDAMFAEIIKLEKLETLIISVDGISQINGIEGLRKLKDLHLKTNREKSLAVFKELSATANNSVERLTLNLWSFEVPAETYEAFGANFSNLKFLKITLGTRHKVNFFAKALPNVEELNIKFGEANHQVEFQDAFESDTGITQSALKKINLKFWGSQEIDQAQFFEMLEMFPSLETLEMNSKFPFSADFFTQLTDKINNVNFIKIGAVDVHNNETYPTATSDALKALAAKVKFVSLSFRNVQQVDFGGGIAPGSDGEDQSFTFQPLVDQLKGVYRGCSSSMANIRIMNDLVLISGSNH